MQRCLIVDKSEIVRKVARHILTESDVRVTEADTGDMAIEMCRVELPDTIIVDGNLDDMPVTEFVDVVRGLRGGDQVRQILCMSKLEIGKVMRAKRMGAAGFFLKPFTRTMLLSALRDIQPSAAKPAVRQKIDAPELLHN